MEGATPSVAIKTGKAETRFYDLIRELELGVDAPNGNCLSLPDAHDGAHADSDTIPQQKTVSAEAVSDVQDRFKLWAGNIGARHRPESALSLESRLAAAEEILEQV